MTGTVAARWEIMLHLSGFPDPVAARRAARVLAAEGGPTDLFWLGALAIEEGRWTDVEAGRLALERQARGDQGEGPDHAWIVEWPPCGAPATTARS